MKIVVCVKRDLEGAIALNKVLKEIGGHDFHVILSDKVLKVEREMTETAAFLFYERDLLVERFFPLLDRIDYPLTQAPRWRTFDRLAHDFSVHVEIIADINSADGERKLRAIAPDVILSIRFDFIFRKHIIDIPRYGILNCHPGELPTYRGVFGSFRAMMDGRQQAGCSLHFIDEGIDTGPLVGICYMDIDYNKSMLWHAVNLYPLAIDLFKAALPILDRDGRLETRPRAGSPSHYYSFPTPAEFTDFRNRGYKLIDYREYLDLLADFQPS